MFIDEELTKHLIESLNKLSDQVYSKNIKIDVEEIVMEALQPYSQQYDISSTDIRISYFYANKCLQIVITLADQKLTVDVFLKEK